MAVLDEIGQYLQDQSLGTLGTDIILGDSKPSPALLVCIYEYPGRTPRDIMGPAGTLPAIDQPRIQVVVRGDSAPGGYAAARSKIDAIWKKLHGVQSQTLSGTAYIRVWALGSPGFLKRDENHRPYLVCNFQVQRVPT